MIEVLLICNQTNLEPKTVYELIQGHGRTDMYLHYATVVGDFERVVEHWVMEEMWSKAIDVINRQVRRLPHLSSTQTYNEHRCKIFVHRMKISW